MLLFTTECQNELWYVEHIVVKILFVVRPRTRASLIIICFMVLVIFASRNCAKHLIDVYSAFQPDQLNNKIRGFDYIRKCRKKVGRYWNRWHHHRGYGMIISVETTLNNLTTAQYAGLMNQWMNDKITNVVSDLNSGNDFTFLLVGSNKLYGGIW